MTEPLDQLDREICGALLRQGRASWRQIAKAIGGQERTIARRGARLLDSGLVRVNARSQYERGESQFAKLSCPPSRLREVASWLAHRDEALWVATLSSESAVVSELFIPFANRRQFIEDELAALPISNYSLRYIDQYHRTVRGWHPNVLSQDALEQLGEDERHALDSAAQALKQEESPHDSTDLDIAKLLAVDGRLSIDAIATAVGVAKPTVRRRISQMQQSGYLSIRAVVDPALLGFPVEALVTVDGANHELGAIGAALADDWRTRWAAEIPSNSQIQALVTAPTRFDLHRMLHTLEARSGGNVHVTASPILTHYKRSDVLLPAALPATGS